MALKISLSTVKAQLSNFVSHSTQCAAAMSTINSNYIEGTNNEWNTPAAATYIDGLCSAFNDYISQFNQYYQEGVDNFVDGVNVLARNEDADPVSPQTVEKLTELSKGWAGQPEDFNIPEDFAGFTNSNLTANINKLIENLSSMQNCIDVAVDNGLQGSFCTSLRESLGKLKSSAEEVAREYDGKAAERAVNQDTAIQTIKSNT